MAGKIFTLQDGWREDITGWVANSDSTCNFFWVPPDMIKILPNPCNQFVISSGGVLLVDYSDLLLGNQWHQCYVPAQQPQ